MRTSGSLGMLRRRRRTCHLSMCGRLSGVRVPLYMPLASLCMHEHVIRWSHMLWTHACNCADMLCALCQSCLPLAMSFIQWHHHDRQSAIMLLLLTHLRMCRIMETCHPGNSDMTSVYTSGHSNLCRMRSTSFWRTCQCPGSRWVCL